MKKIYYNPNNVPPTWYTGIPAVETSVMISQEDFDFCELVAHKYKLNLNEFCALVHHAREAKPEMLSESHPLSEMLSNGATIKEISVTTSQGTAKLNDPFIIFEITRLYRGMQKFGTTFRGLLAELLSYLENQNKGRSQRHTIIGMICAYLEIYPKNYPLHKEHEWTRKDKSWKAYLKERVKQWVRDFDM